MAALKRLRQAVRRALQWSASPGLAARGAVGGVAFSTVCCALLLLAPPATAACPPPLPGVGAAGAAGPAPDRGLLWRITQGGHSSWLFGTLHVGKPAWRHLGPRVTAALRASDLLAVEIDPDDPALPQALAETGPPLVLPEALQARLARAFESACIDPAALAALHPLLQVTTLTVLEARWLGLDAAYAQEQLLLAQGRAEGSRPARRVVALETAAQQKSALLPDDPAEALATLEQGLTQLEDHSGRPVLARLARAWESGDLQALSSYAQWCACANSEAERAFMRRLNDERNPALADGIAAWHRAGHRVFAAVGALHMTGPAGLPLLLAQRGFRVERIVFGR
jgi:uncharacterized protein YbaP (TraB family)